MFLSYENAAGGYQHFHQAAFAMSSEERAAALSRLERVEAQSEVGVFAAMVDGLAKLRQLPCQLGSHGRWGLRVQDGDCGARGARSEVALPHFPRKIL